MRFDYTAVGFHTFDALCHPVNSIPPNGDTFFVDDFAIAISGAAGAAAVVAAKHGLSVQAVGGLGEDLMGDWVLNRMHDFRINTDLMVRCPGYATSSSIVTTRPDGQRPALHKKGATGGFFVEDDQIDSVLDTKILHIGGVGLIDRMDPARNAEIFKEAKKRGCITTLDVFAATSDDLKLVKPLLENTDYFMPSEIEAMALSGMTDFEDIAKFLLDFGTKAVVMTLGENGVMYRDAAGNCIDLPAFDIEVVCTCGCGDCFNAGFATGIHLNEPIDKCLKLGQAAAAQNSMGLGSQAIIKDLSTTINFLENTPSRS